MKTLNLNTVYFNIETLVRVRLNSRTRNNVCVAQFKVSASRSMFACGRELEFLSAEMQHCRDERLRPNVFMFVGNGQEKTSYN